MSMKRLLLLRHAKSSWKKKALADFERPLNKRGRRDAPRMGKLLRDENLLPEVIFASSAVRTLETARLLAEAGAFAGELHSEDDLYLAPASQYIELLHSSGGAADSVLMIGHNPGMQTLVSCLAGSQQTFPTAALAWFELPVDSWSELTLTPTTGPRKIWRPKEID